MAITSDVKVREYSTRELLFLMKKANGFIDYPKGFFLCGVRSKMDTINKFDDKMYLMQNTGNAIISLLVTSCTTNAGLSGLMDYKKYSSKGVAVLKSNQWYYGFWTYGLHKGKMPALKQVGNALLFRDSNKNIRNDETGVLEKGLFGINFHTATYEGKAGFIAKLIGGWSVGCQVLNNFSDYEFILNKVKNQSKISYILLKED
jgi:hypothetical protein